MLQYDFTFVRETYQEEAFLYILTECIIQKKNRLHTPLRGWKKQRTLAISMQHAPFIKERVGKSDIINSFLNVAKTQINFCGLISRVFLFFCFVCLF